ncbi:MAG TPA: hypothetical protein VN257_06075 [Actinotalea sp.]|nr:hypothetical protein [Actinotalea sp.]
MHHPEEVDVHRVLLAAEEHAEAATQLPIPPVGFGLLAFGGLLALLAVTYAFRSVGTRH